MKMGISRSVQVRVTSNLLRLSILLAAALACTATMHAQDTPTIAIHLDPTASTVQWTLKSFLSNAHGTFKLKGGDIVVNPQSGLAQGEVLVDATTGASDNAARDIRWNKNVIDSPTYPSIIFHPTKIEGLKGTDGSQQVKAIGTLTLLGKDHPVELAMNANVQGKAITLTTHLVVPYVEWGLKQATNGLSRYDKQVAIDLSAKGILVMETAKPITASQ